MGVEKCSDHRGCAWLWQPRVQLKHVGHSFLCPHRRSELHRKHVNLHVPKHTQIHKSSTDPGHTDAQVPPSSPVDLGHTCTVSHCSPTEPGYTNKQFYHVPTDLGHTDTWVPHSPEVGTEMAILHWPCSTFWGSPAVNLALPGMAETMGSQGTLESHETPLCTSPLPWHSLSANEKTYSK